MLTASQDMCLLAEHLQRDRNSHRLVHRLPEVPKLPAKGTHDTFGNPFETVANCSCRFVLHPAVLVPDSC